MRNIIIMNKYYNKLVYINNKIENLTREDIEELLKIDSDINLIERIKQVNAEIVESIDIMEYMKECQIMREFSLYEYIQKIMEHISLISVSDQQAIPKSDNLKNVIKLLDNIHATLSKTIVSINEMTKSLKKLYDPIYKKKDLCLGKISNIILDDLQQIIMGYNGNIMDRTFMIMSFVMDCVRMSNIVRKHCEKMNGFSTEILSMNINNLQLHKTEKMKIDIKVALIKTLESEMKIVWKTCLEMWRDYCDYVQIQIDCWTFAPTQSDWRISTSNLPYSISLETIQKYKMLLRNKNTKILDQRQNKLLDFLGKSMENVRSKDIGCSVIECQRELYQDLILLNYIAK
jgi:hypothetical protein